MEAAAGHHLGVGAYLAWHPDDRDADLALRVHRGETCDGCGVHPSVWQPELGGRRNALVPRWRFCQICHLVGKAREAGPPRNPDLPRNASQSEGWHLYLGPPNTPTSEEAGRGVK